MAELIRVESNGMSLSTSNPKQQYIYIYKCSICGGERGYIMRRDNAKVICYKCRDKISKEYQKNYIRKEKRENGGT